MLSRSATIDIPAEQVFAYVDDVGNLARHMSEQGSMTMMGSRLALEIVTPELMGAGAIYRYADRMMGLTIDFSETVTRYVLGREKMWRTIRQPRLLVINSCEMRVLPQPIADARSRLTITIDCEIARAGLWRLIGRVLADPCAQGCLGGMIEGTVQDLQRGAA